MKPKILLVEDNDYNGYLARFLLERAGFTVAVALNGNQAIEAARLDRPDLVVMDIHMPEMDGYEAAQCFKSDPVLAGIPLVGVSSFAMAADRAKALQVGFVGYIEKPINIATFVQEVARFLKSNPPPAVKP